MEYLLSGTAFLMALASVWFVSHSSKNLNAYFNEFLEINIKSLRQELGTAKKEIKDLSYRIIDIQNDRSHKDEQKELLAKIESLQIEVETLNNKLPKGPKRQTAHSNRNKKDN